MAGPNPNFASAWTQAGLAIKVFDQIAALASTATPNLLDMLDELQTGVDGVYTSGYEAIVRSLAAGPIAAALAPAAIQAAWLPALRELGDIINSKQTDPKLILADLRVYMTDNSQTINSLNITHGTPAADATSHGGSGNTGDFDLVRLTVDENGDELPTSPEVKFAEVTQDQNSGAREWAEQLSFYGSPPRQFPLEFAGSGDTLGSISFVHGGAESTGQWLQNPSFDQGTHTPDAVLASTTAVTGWTVANKDNWTSRTTYVARGYPGAPTVQYGLENTASDSITQVLQTTRPQVNYAAGPVFLQIRWKRLASATGTITLTLGAESTSATIGSATNGEWNTLRLAVGTKCWFNNFNQDALAVTIATTSLATGTVAIDDTGMGLFTLIDGTYYAASGGSGNDFTPPEVLDRFTWTDSHADSAILAYWLWRGFGPDGYLPAATGDAESIADPS